MAEKKVKHTCQFLEIAQVSGNIWGIICGCPICGEVRELSRTGEVKIIAKAWQKKV